MATTYITIGNRRYADISGGGAEEGPFVPASYLVDPATGEPASAGGGGGGDASAANQTTQTARLDSILAKIIAAPATEASLAAVLAKIIAAPSTSAKQDTIITALAALPQATTGFGHGVTVVTTAGTDVALAASTAAKWVTIQAQTDNTNKVAVGATGVDAAVATGTGILVSPGDSITLAVDNLADVFIDSLVNGEGVRYVYGT